MIVYCIDGIVRVWWVAKDLAQLLDRGYNCLHDYHPNDLRKRQKTLPEIT